MAETVAAFVPLKEANGKKLFAVLALNVAAYYIAFHALEVSAADWLKLATGWASALPAGVGIAVVAILNAQISGDAKARLVFWRWDNPYPGSRAFTVYGPADHRVDMSMLEKSFGPLPTDPRGQNILWYQMYRTVADAPAVTNSHQQYLFARDYSFLSLSILLILGSGAALFIRPLPIAAAYIAMMIGQWGFATRAANVNGCRFVTTVLAQKGAGD